MCNSHTFAIPRDQLTDLQQLFGFIVNLGASSSPYWVVCIHVSHYHVFCQKALSQFIS